MVEKFIGDAVVGVFGVPAAHEDDAERAVSAGLASSRRSRAMTRPDGSPLQVRIGINTGEALVRLDVAPGLRRALPHRRRRQHRGAPAVRRPAQRRRGRRADPRPSPRELSSSTALEPLALKGKAEAVRAWLAVAAASPHGARTASRSPRPSSAAKRSSPPFAGLSGRPRPRLRSSASSSASPASASAASFSSSPAPRRQARARHLAPGPLPALRRGGHVLGALGDRQGAGRHPGFRRRRDRGSEARGGAARGRGRGLAPPAPASARWASRRPRPPARRASPPGATSSSPSPRRPRGPRARGPALGR